MEQVKKIPRSRSKTDRLRNLGWSRAISPAPDVFLRLRHRVKHFGSGSTQKISAPTGAGSENQIVKKNLAVLHPDFYTNKKI